MIDPDEFLTRCGLTKQYGIRHPSTPPLFSVYDEWYEDAADCFITFADDDEAGAVMIERWVGPTWLI